VGFRLVRPALLVAVLPAATCRDAGDSHVSPTSGISAMLVVLRRALHLRVSQSLRVSWTTLIAALAMLLSTSTAYAQPWTVTMAGTIKSGYRRSGITLDNLVNKNYALSLTVDPTLFTQYEVVEGASFATGNNYNPLSVLFTMDGVSSTYLITQYTALGPTSLLTRIGGFQQEETVFQNAFGRTSDGFQLDAVINFRASTNTGLTSDFGQRYSGPASGPYRTSNVKFTVTDDADTFFIDMVDYSPETITINGGPVAVVPEPATFILTAAGLVLLGIVARRRPRLR
jgi:PEP-CTERM motif